MTTAVGRALAAVSQSCWCCGCAALWCALVQATSRFKHSMELMRKMTVQSKALVQEH